MCGSLMCSKILFLNVYDGKMINISFFFFQLVFGIVILLLLSLLHKFMALVNFII